MIRSGGADLERDRDRDLDESRDRDLERDAASSSRGRRRSRRLKRRTLSLLPSGLARAAFFFVRIAFFFAGEFVSGPDGISGGACAPDRAADRSSSSSSLGARKPPASSRIETFSSK